MVNQKWTGFHLLNTLNHGTICKAMDNLLIFTRHELYVNIIISIKTYFISIIIIKWFNKIGGKKHIQIAKLHI